MLTTFLLSILIESIYKRLAIEICWMPWSSRGMTEKQDIQGRLFKITRSRKKTEFSNKISYPRVIEHIGKNTEQYPMCKEYDE